MCRLIILLAVITLAIADGRVHAQRDFSLFGFSVGVGSYPYYGYPRPGEFNPYRFDPYLHDPYRFGTFEAPDLLKDPYFRERHRYDSQFPGRRRQRYRSPLVVRSTPVERHQVYRAPVEPAAPSVDMSMVEVDPAELDIRLQTSSTQLSRSLAALQYSQAWNDYLEPHRIIDLMNREERTELNALATRYHTVAGNPRYRAIASADGFGMTRSLLSQWLRQGPGVELNPARPESIPTPQPLDPQ